MFLGVSNKELDIPMRSECWHWWSRDCPLCTQASQEEVASVFNATSGICHGLDAPRKGSHCLPGIEGPRVNEKRAYRGETTKTITNFKALRPMSVMRESVDGGNSTGARRIALATVTVVRSESAIGSANVIQAPLAAGRNS
jgi:hypothetical protein